MSGTQIDVPDTMHFADQDRSANQEVDESRFIGNPRERMLAEIAARREEQRQAELDHAETLAREAAGVEPDAPVEPAPAEEPAAPSEEVSASSEPAVAPPAAVSAPQPVAAPQVLTVTLPGGHQFQVTPEQYQHLAAQGALANLAIQQHRQAPPAPLAAPAPPAGPLIEPEKLSAIAQRISYGTPEEQTAALAEYGEQIANRVRQQPVDANQISQQAAQQAWAYTQAQLQLQNDLNAIGQEFPVIFNGRALSAGAAAELNEIRQRDALLGVNRPAIEQYREACNRVMSQLPATMTQPQSAGGQGENPPALQAANQSQRLERKRAAPRNPVPVSRVASLGEASSQGPSGSQIVAAMRQQRHQVPMN